MQAKPSHTNANTLPTGCVSCSIELSENIDLHNFPKTGNRTQPSELPADDDTPTHTETKYSTCTLPSDTIAITFFNMYDQDTI
jgi:hypothetical protein